MFARQQWLVIVTAMYHDFSRKGSPIKPLMAPDHGKHLSSYISGRPRAVLDLLSTNIGMLQYH
jgi:hypothetical protein